MARLNPCPECGATGQYPGEYIDFETRTSIYRACCNVCGFEMGPFRSKEMACKAWNKVSELSEELTEDYLVTEKVDSHDFEDVFNLVMSTRSEICGALYTNDVSNFAQALSQRVDRANDISVQCHKEKSVQYLLGHYCGAISAYSDVLRYYKNRQAQKAKKIPLPNLPSMPHIDEVIWLIYNTKNEIDYSELEKESGLERLELIKILTALLEEKAISSVNGRYYWVTESGKAYCEQIKAKNAEVGG